MSDGGGFLQEQGEKKEKHFVNGDLYIGEIGPSGEAGRVGMLVQPDFAAGAAAACQHARADACVAPLPLAGLLQPDGDGKYVWKDGGVFEGSWKVGFLPSSCWWCRRGGPGLPSAQPNK